MTFMAQHSPSDSTSTIPQTDTGHTESHAGWRQLLQRKLLLSVTIPTAIGLVQLAFASYDIAAGDARALVLLFMLPALIVGYLFGRRVKIAWDDKSAQVSLIQAQVLLTIAYIVVRIGTHILLERALASRIQGVATAVLIVSFGLFFGRSLALAVQIWHALTSRNSPATADSDFP